MINRFDVPVIGGQIFIEPGQTSEEIDTWFSMLKQHNMPICRIRMFETYMHKADGTWDFSRYCRQVDSTLRQQYMVIRSTFLSMNSIPFQQPTHTVGPR